MRAPAILVLLLAMPAVVERGVEQFAQVSAPAATLPGGVVVTATTEATPALGCRTAEAMSEIASLPPSVVFASLNLGPAIVAYTPQATTSAGYHRNTAAFWNGVGAFQSRNDLRDALASSRADHLVVCVGAGEESIITRLEDDAWPDWLTEVTDDRRFVRAFKVDQAALARDGVTP
jgi:hypothetical protein